MYRPFSKKWLHYQKEIIERPGKFETQFGTSNLAICITGKGAKKSFSTLITNIIPNLNMMEAGTQVFLLKSNDNNSLFEESYNIDLLFAKKVNLSEEDTFYYVYGVLHSPEYIEKYINDLKKSIPRIPILKNKEVYVKIGRQLAQLHLNYEMNSTYADLIIESKENPSYKVTKMKYFKKGKHDKIVFNGDITISNIPEKSYEYQINGRAAIEWIIDQYQIKIDKNSGIKDDPNTYSTDEKYIFNLLLSIINVSVQSIDLINNLPPLEIIE